MPTGVVFLNCDMTHARNIPPQSDIRYQRALPSGSLNSTPAQLQASLGAVWDPTELQSCRGLQQLPDCGCHGKLRIVAEGRRQFRHVLPQRRPTRTPQAAYLASLQQHHGLRHGNEKQGPLPRPSMLVHLAAWPVPEAVNSTMPVNHLKRQLSMLESTSTSRSKSRPAIRWAE